jgi:hypothetical protein
MWIRSTGRESIIVPRIASRRLGESVRLLGQRSRRYRVVRRMI